MTVVETDELVAYTAMVIGDEEFRRRAAGWLRPSGAVRIIGAATVRQGRAWPRVAPVRTVVALTQADLPDGHCFTMARELLYVGWKVVIAAKSLQAVQAAVEVGAGACILQGTDRRPSAKAAAELYGLSDREVTVLEAVADGLSNNKIGKRLGLSGLTVKSHLARIGPKLGTGDRAGMVVRAIRAGII